MSAPAARPLDSHTLAAALQPGGELARRFEALWLAVWQQPHVPAGVLELCRLRLAQLHAAAAELEALPPAEVRAGIDPAKVASLLAGRWTRDAAFSPAERAALELAEVYGQDPQAITDELAAEVVRHFGEPGLVALIEALGLIDGRIRLALLLGPLLPQEPPHE